MRHHEIFIYDEGRKVCDGVEQPVPESEIRAWLDRELNALHEEHRKAQETYQRACKKISDARSELFALMQKNGVRSGHEGPEKKGLPE
jgi:thioredoxin-like negative regulator of GroEL